MSEQGRVTRACSPWRAFRDSQSSVDSVAFAQQARPFLSPTNIFAPASTPAQSIFELSMFRAVVTAAIFVVVFSLLAYAVVKFRKKSRERWHASPRRFTEAPNWSLAWTVDPDSHRGGSVSWRPRA